MNITTAQQMTIESTARGLALDAKQARARIAKLAERMAAEAAQLTDAINKPGQLAPVSNVHAEVVAETSRYNMALTTLATLLGDRFESVIEALIVSPWTAPIA